MGYAEKYTTKKWGTVYRARWRGSDGRLMCSDPPHFKKKRGAERHAAVKEAEAAAVSGRGRRRPEMPLGEWIHQHWWPLLLHEPPDANTVTQYKSLIDNHILARWGDVPLNEIDPVAVFDWLAAIPAVRPGDGEQPATLAASTTRTIRVLMHAILEAAVDDKLIDSNPARLRRRTRKPVAPDPEDEDDFDEDDAGDGAYVPLDRAREVADQVRILGGDMAYVMVLLAAFTGMRWGELVGLERKYVRFADKSIRVAWQLAEINGKWVKKLPKGNKRRTVYLPQPAWDLLAAWMAATKLPKGHPLKDYVFLTPLSSPRGGKHPRRSGFDRRVWRIAIDGREETRSERGTRRVLKRGMPGVDGLNGAVFHGLRHGFLTHLKQIGAPDVAMREWLGHAKSRDVQDTYSHMTPEMIKTIVAALATAWEAQFEESDRERIGSETPHALPK